MNNKYIHDRNDNEAYNTTLTANFIAINRSVNNPFSEYSLSVLFSEHFAVWWDNNLEINHTKDAIILRVSYQHFQKQIYSFIYILKTSVRSNKS